MMGKVLTRILIASFLSLWLFLFFYDIYVGYKNNPKFEACEINKGILYTNRQAGIFDKYNTAYCIDKNERILYSTQVLVF